MVQKEERWAVWPERIMPRRQSAIEAAQRQPRQGRAGLIEKRSTFFGRAVRAVSRAGMFLGPADNTGSPAWPMVTSRLSQIHVRWPTVSSCFPTVSSIVRFGAT